MLRQLDHYRSAAGSVTADLRRVLGPTWRCDVGEDWVVTVSDGTRAERSPLHRAIEDEDWFSDDTWNAHDQAEALVAEAIETVAAEAVELLRALGGALTCHEHDVALSSCCGDWCCDGGTRGGEHHVAWVGRLGTGHPTAALGTDGAR